MSDVACLSVGQRPSVRPSAVRPPNTDVRAVRRPNRSICEYLLFRDGLIGHVSGGRRHVDCLPPEQTRSSPTGCCSLCIQNIQPPAHRSQTTWVTDARLLMTEDPRDAASCPRSPSQVFWHPYDNSISAPGKGVEYCDESVCLSLPISPEPHVRTSPSFLCTLRVAAARSSPGGAAICYVLPVFWMTSCFPAMVLRRRDSTAAVSLQYRPQLSGTGCVLFQTTTGAKTRWVLYTMGAAGEVRGAPLPCLTLRRPWQLMVNVTCSFEAWVSVESGTSREPFHTGNFYFAILAKFRQKITT